MPESTAAARADHDLAVELAEGAGRLLVELRSELAERRTATHVVKAEGDRRAHVWLMQRLADSRPDDAVLSEESTAAEHRVRHRSGGRVWIVDPLDGTREYGEGRSDWAVHVALAIDGALVAGAVALPGQDVVFGTADPPPLPPAPATPRVVVSRSRPPYEALAIADALHGELVPMGSAGAKAMSILQGLSDLYPHSGGQYEWDSAAPVAVAAAAGLHCSRLDGSPLTYDRHDPWLPDLLVCRPELAEAALDAANGGRPRGGWTRGTVG